MTQYINKSTIVSEIERRLEALANTSTGDNREFAAIIGAQHYELINLVQYINTLEVKEVDLNDEYIEEIYSHIDGIKDTADRMTSGNFMHHRAAIKFSANVIGQVLGLIGLKRQKGE